LVALFVVLDLPHAVVLVGPLADIAQQEPTHALKKREPRFPNRARIAYMLGGDGESVGHEAILLLAENFGENFPRGIFGTRLTREHTAQALREPVPLNARVRHRLRRRAVHCANFCEAIHDKLS
jgi:hypothetical protein